MNNKLTFDRAHFLFSYKDGLLLWKPFSKKYRGHRKDYTVAGCTNPQGYVQVWVDGKTYGAHRIIFLMHHGYLPEGEVDHIDRNPSNNRIENLREVGRVCNCRNRGQIDGTSSGVKGVSMVKGKWYAYIKISKKNCFLGSFHTLDEAVCCRLAHEQSTNWDGCDSDSPAYKYVEEMLRSGISRPYEHMIPEGMDHIFRMQKAPQRDETTSSVKGVCWVARNSKWVAYITVLRKRITIGSSKDLTEAVCLRLAAEQAYDWAGCYTTSPAYQYVKKQLFGQ